MEPTEEIKIGVDCDTTAVDEAIEKLGEVGELAGDMSPQVSIRNCRGCTFNIYPSRTWFVERGDAE